MMKTIFKLTVVAAALVSVSAFAASNNPTPTKYDTLQDIAIQSNKDFNDYQQGKIVQNESDIRDLQNETTRQFDQVNTYVKSVDRARADGDAALGQRIETLEKAPKPLDGKDGKDGKDGINGKDGVDGIDGLNGKDGKDGTNGVDGRDGVDGQNGADGKDGQAGAAGAKGDAGTNGRDGTDGVNGKDADMTLVNKNTADIKQQRVDFTQRYADTDQRIAQHKADQQKVNKAVADKLDNHEGRISNLEQQSNSKFAELDKRVKDVKKHASAGTASAFAQANIPQVMSGGEFGIGAGAGTYDGESAIAVGASYAPRDNIVLKATVSSDTMHNFGAGAGVMVSFH